MDKKKITEFFDRMAPEWDAGTEPNKEIIGIILDYAGIDEGVSVLDVGCGTGVLIPEYLERNVSRIIGIDISEKMIEIAKGKFTDPRVSFVCADAETASFDEKFDRCVIYNAFPHFPDPYALIKNLAVYIKPGGSLTIAHGSSREHIDRHHMEHARDVSVKLMPDSELETLLSPYFNVVISISDDRMQQIVGIKK